MPSCVVKDCSNHSRKVKKNDGVTFHRFLRNGHEKRDTWVKFVRKDRDDENWLPTEFTYICSLHFKEEDKYSSKTGRVYLKENAEPYDYKNTPISGPSTDEQSKTSVPISVPVGKSSLEIVLRKKLLKETTARKNLAKKIKVLQRQNRYLREKCEAYKNIVSELQENLI